MPRPRCEHLGLAVSLVRMGRPRCADRVGLAVGICGLGDLRCCGSEFTGWVCGVYSTESILTMPVVTTLFRNLFDMIFTIFYGCRTVFNGVGPVTHPHITISSSVQKVDSVLNRTDLDPPHAVLCAVVPTVLHCVSVLCARVACALSTAVCLCVLVCMCALCMCPMYLCVSTPWF